jgi:hypothetical protein
MTFCVKCHLEIQKLTNPRYQNDPLVGEWGIPRPYLGTSGYVFWDWICSQTSLNENTLLHKPEERLITLAREYLRNHPEEQE